MQGLNEIIKANSFAAFAEAVRNDTVNQFHDRVSQAPGYEGLSPAGYRAAANGRWPNGDVQGLNQAVAA